MEKKIIFLASCPHSLLNFRLHLMREFLQRKYQVIALAPQDEQVAEKLSSLGIQFQPVRLDRNGRNPIKDIKNFFNLLKIIQQEKPQYIFSYTIKPVIYGSLAAKLAGVPAIYSMITGVGYAFSESSNMSNFVGLVAKNLFRFTLRYNQKIFFQNIDNANLFLNKRMITSPEKITIVNGSGVDITHFDYKTIPKKLCFLMIARLLYDKGIREYIQAAQIIKQDYPDVVFQLAGWIDTNPNSISQTELNQWIASGVIEYLGKLSDVRQAMTNASVYVLPSYAEGTPRTVLEAMSMGRPIITTNVPGCKETVQPGVNGLLIPARNVTELCNAIRFFIDHPEKIEAMGKQSREIAVAKYDVHKVNASILEAMGV